LFPKLRWKDAVENGIIMMRIVNLRKLCRIGVDCSSLWDSGPTEEEEEEGGGGEGEEEKKKVVIFSSVFT
jgi:hypothetical protein